MLVVYAYMLKTMTTTIAIILLSSSVIQSCSPISNGSTSKSQSIIESSSLANNFSVKEYQIPSGSHPHDVVPRITNQKIALLFGLLHKQQNSWAS